MKKIVILLIIGQIVASMITYVVCYFLGYSTLRDAVDVAFVVSFGFVFIGICSPSVDVRIYLSTGYEDGADVEDENERDVAQNNLMSLIFVVSGIMWAILSYAIYYVFGR